MNKKGFTLIELLSIIVILAIIALIAVPVVLNIVNKAELSSYERSSENILEAARLLYRESKIDRDIDITGDKFDEIIKTISGNTPDEGQIYLKSGGKIAMLLKYGGNCYVKSYDDNSIAHSAGEDCSSSEKEFTNDRILDLATEYYNNTKETEGIYNAIEDQVGGKKPNTTEIKINSEEKIAIALGYADVCYVKEYDEDNFIKTDITSESMCTTYKCIRANLDTLHTEECTQTSNNCYAAGYTTDGSKKTTTITYGNEDITEGTLTSGDAFDCDVDGDKIYDSVTERFYYVTEFTSNDNEYAVLVYYNNTANGIVDNSSSSLVAYDSTGENWHGPVTAITNLPTTTQWNNIRLSSIGRAITTQRGTNSTTGGALPTDFSYTKIVNGKTVPLAARLLTYQEVATACGGDGNPTTDGALDRCNYLIENTKYSNNSLGTWGYWLETPSGSYSNYAWRVIVTRRSLVHNIADNSTYHGTRPAIEVLKYEISF